MNGCSCADHGATDLDKLDHLVNDLGWDQLRASRFLWSSDLPDQLAWARVRAVQIVWARMAGVLAWLHGAGVAA